MYVTTYVQAARIRGTVRQHAEILPLAGPTSTHLRQEREIAGPSGRVSGPRGEAVTSAAGQSSRPNPTAHPAGVLGGTSCTSTSSACVVPSGRCHPYVWPSW